jgi:CRP-like cAMP-binding protein
MSTSLKHYDFLISRIKDYIFLSNKETELVISLFTEEHFKNNEAILKEGDICKKLYFVANGVVRFSQIVNGEERTFVFRSEGAFCNDLESFLKKTPSQNFISAIGPTTVLSITFDNLQIFYNQTTFGDRFGRLAIEQVFVQVVNLLTTFYSASPGQRYKRFAMNHKQLTQRIPQYHIASHIGVTPQALCRIKKKLLDRNL